MTEESAGTTPNRSPTRAILDHAFESLRIPPLAQRVALGVLLALGIYIVSVGLPIYALEVLASYNLPVNLSESALGYYGGALAILAGAAYVMRPYRAYGPLAMATNAAEILYLFVFYAASPLGVSLTGGGSVTAVAVGYAAVILILMLVAVFYMAGNAVTAYEDFARPGERLYHTYPAR